MSTESLVPPHGGTLINRIVSETQAATLREEAANLPRIELSSKQACDLEMIAIGAFSPLTGYVGKADFDSICNEMRLANGTVFPIPVTLAVDETVKGTLSEGGRLRSMCP